MRGKRCSTCRCLLCPAGSLAVMWSSIDWSLHIMLAGQLYSSYNFSPAVLSVGNGVYSGLVRDSSATVWILRAVSPSGCRLFETPLEELTVPPSRGAAPCDPGFYCMFILARFILMTFCCYWACVWGDCACIWWAALSAWDCEESKTGVLTSRTCWLYDGWFCCCWLIICCLANCIRFWCGLLDTGRPVLAIPGCIVPSYAPPEASEIEFWVMCHTTASLFDIFVLFDWSSAKLKFWGISVFWIAAPLFALCWRPSAC